MRSHNLKNHLFFGIAFSITILVFLYPLITMRSSFLFGDYFVQFYPWLKCYSEAIKNLSFPYWIKAMGSGFPLMAEGQVGGFYPLNMILFFVFPLNAAYNISIILHFIIGGVFTYLYSQKTGAGKIGGYIAALLFCFGSAYGGCFYNIATLNTLAWFPLVLLLFEYYFKSSHLKYIVFSGIIMGFQFLAGFVQMAAYSASFCLVYFIYRSSVEKKGIKNSIYAISILSAISFMIALPQLLLTYQLSTFSGRENATLSFALWRSFFPLNFAGMVFPYPFSLSHAYFYVGILSLFFVISGFFAVPGSRLLKGAVLILILSIFFSIGWFNPLYVAFLKITRLYFFRNPTKFLFFGEFALAVLAGTGYTRFFETDNKKEKDRVAFIFRLVLVIAAGIFLITKLILLLFRNNILDFGHFFVKNFIFNRPDHRYSLEFYFNVVNSSYERMLSIFSFSNLFVLSSWILVIIAAAMMWFLRKKWAKSLCAAIIFADIFIFSFYGIGFRMNIKPFSYLKPDTPEIIEKLKKDPEVYRILPFDLKPGNLPNWSAPNANVMYGVDSIACYTPLAMRDYKAKLSGFEVVDDSLGLRIPAEGAISKNIDIVRLLNVKYVITDKKLDDPFLENLFTENGITLYGVKNYFPRIFFSYSEKDIKPTGEIKIIDYRDGFLEAETSNDKDGFVIFSENFYPGWHVYVDGKEGRLIKIKGIVQGVAVKSGEHKVTFIFKPAFTVRR